MITIRLAQANNICDVVKIYDDILTCEENQKINVGWRRGIYPTENTALNALNNQQLFIMTDEEKVVAAAIINQKQVPEYSQAKWQYNDIDPKNIMVLHTLVVAPDMSGKGYGSKFVEFYENYAAKNKCFYLRMDTNAKNMCARKLYRQLGYHEAGIVPCDFNGIDNISLVCLEKKIDCKD